MTDDHENKENYGGDNIGGKNKSTPRSKAVVKKNQNNKNNGATTVTTMASKLWQTFIAFMAHSRVYECGSTVSTERKHDLCFEIYSELCKAFVEKKSSEKSGIIFTLSSITTGMHMYIIMLYILCM